MKKNSRAWVYLFGIVMAPLLMLCGFQLGNWAKNKDFGTVAPTDQIAEYRQELSYINTMFENETQNRIIVKTKRNIVDKKAVSVANGYSGLNVLQYASYQDATDALEYYSSLDYVTFCERDFEISCNDLPDNIAPENVRGTNNLSWGADLLGVGTYQQYILAKYKDVKNLPTVYIAVLDTGIDTDNEFLQGRIAFDLGISYYDSALYTGKISTYKFEDDNSHGTHVSGTIVDLTQSNVKIIPIKVLNSKGSGSMSNVLSGIEYVLNLKKLGNNVCAFNMSLGGYGYSQQEEKIIDSCFETNIMPVVAAGNENYFSKYFSPSSAKNALTISALARNEKYQNGLNLAYYSNYGSNVDLCLPGSKILSCVPNECTYEQIYTSKTGGKYAVISGTSMATPHATALVALYATYYGNDFEVKTVEQNLKNSTYDFGAKGQDDAFGFGVPNMELGIDKFVLDKAPKLSFGSVGSSFNFEDSILVKIENQNKKYNGYEYKIVYTTDGTYPTTVAGLTYISPLNISQSTSLKIAIYLLDGNGNVCADSECFQVDYFKGTSTCNDDGTGFVIDKNGVVTEYKSGLENIILPQYINGVKVTKLGDDLFCGRGIKSFVCDFDVLIDGYPFCCCDGLEELTLGSTDATTLAQYCPLLKTLNLPNANQIGDGNTNIRLFGYFFGSKTVLGCFALENVSLPKITEVPDNAFSDFVNLDNVDLDFENLTRIGKNAFNFCQKLELSINCPQLVELGESAFYNTKIKEFCADRLEVVESNTFDMCNNLEKLILKSVVKLKKHAFGCKTAQTQIFLGQRDVTITKNAFDVSKNSKVTIFCFDANGISLATGVRCVEASVSLKSNSEEKTDFDITGYNCNVKTYVSDDNKLDPNDELVDCQSFEGFNFGTNYTFEKFTNQKKYYISVVEDQYSNQCQNIINATGEKKAYKIKINNLCDSVVTDEMAYSFYEGEIVVLTAEQFKGTKFVSMNVDGVDVTKDVSNDTYTFVMPCKDLSVQINYEKILYVVKVEISGSGNCQVKDQYDNQIATAYFNQPIFVEYSDDKNYVSTLYYISSEGRKYALEINEQSTALLMPNCDISIYISFKKVDFDDFGILCDSNEKTFEVYKYKGNDTIVNIPQYYTRNSIRYRLSKISVLAFANNQSVKFVNVVFASKDIDIEIEMYAFQNCTNLESVSVGNITVIGNGSFDNCGKLKDIDLKNCREVGRNAFNGCNSLISVDLTNCESLKESAFYACENLLMVELGNNIKYIPERCFARCSSLQNIDLKNVETIGEKAFYSCFSLSDIDLSSCTLFEKNENGDGYNFYDCADLQNVTLGKDLKVLPSYAFGGCNGIGNTDFSNLEEVGSNAFTFSSNQKIYLPKLKKIGSYPFQYARRFVLAEPGLLGSECKLSYFLSYIYVEKQNENYVGSFIKQRCNNRLEINDYIVYTSCNAKVITFELEDGTILSQDCYAWTEEYSVPKYFEKDGERQKIAKWQIKGTDTFVLEYQIKHTGQNMTYVAVLVPEKLSIKFFYNFDFDHSGTKNDEGDLAFVLEFDYDDKIVLTKFECDCVQKIPFFDIRLKINQNYYYSFQMYLDLYLTFEKWDKDIDGKYISDIFDMFDQNGELCLFANYKPKDVKICFSAQKLERTSFNGKIVLINLFGDSEFKDVTSSVDKNSLESKLENMFPDGAENYILEKFDTGFQLVKAV